MLILSYREGKTRVLTYEDITIKIMVAAIHDQEAKITVDAPGAVEDGKGRASFSRITVERTNDNVRVRRFNTRAYAPLP